MAHPQLTHLNAAGEITMVDVGDKAVTTRTATAEGKIHMPPELVDTLERLKKGNALETARLAGIKAAKKTSDLIPLCHNLFLEKVGLTFETNREEGWVRAEATVRCTAKTGVEMEALTAVNVALLTLYDMGKAAARDMYLDGIRLLPKEGGASGTYTAGPLPTTPNA